MDGGAVRTGLGVDLLQRSVQAGESRTHNRSAASSPVFRA